MLNKVFIGSDPRQPISVNVLSQSIHANSSKPVQITPLILRQLPLKRMGLTEFTFSRFLVPYLCEYEGWALFLDADMLVLGDITELFSYADDRYSVMVSKNPMRFEWASAILFNCARCKMLTPEYIESADGLHTFKFLPEEEIGEFDGAWNHLVGYDDRRDDAKLIHYTQGVPGFVECKSSEYSKEWYDYANILNQICSWYDILGNSVHAEQIGNQVMPKYVAKELIKSELLI